MVNSASLSQWYAILDLDPSATWEDVRASYVDLVKVWHPDRFQHDSSRLRGRAEEKIKAINRAYEAIRGGLPEGADTGFPHRPREATKLYPKDFGGVWGYVNAEGKLVIAPRYEVAAPFADGLGRVMARDRWGYVDSRGVEIIPPEFSKARDFAEGLAAVAFRLKWSYIDKTGEYAVSALYDDCGEFSEGLAAVLWYGRWGFLDRTGKFAITPRFQAANAFKDGRAAVKLGERWGQVNRAGEVFFVEKAEIG